MADKYEVLSVKSPVIAPPPGSSGYPDTFTNWTELELRPWLEPGIAAIGGYSTERKILIPPATNERLKPAKGDVIELSMALARVGAQTMSPTVIDRSEITGYSKTVEPNAHLFNAKNKTITYPPELVELLKDGEYTTQVNPGDGKRLEVIVWKKVKTLYVGKIILDDIKQVEHAVEYP